MRADALRDKQTVVKQEIRKQAEERRQMQDNKNEDSGSDSDDFEDLLDWRAKRVL